jgi:hypothetical protein
MVKNDQLVKKITSKGTDTQQRHHRGIEAHQNANAGVAQAPALTRKKEEKIC